MIKIQFNVWTLISVAIVLWAGSVAYSHQDAMKQNAMVLQPGDSMIIWLDANTRRQRRVEINSTLDEKQVRIVTEFRDLPHGPPYKACRITAMAHRAGLAAGTFA